MARKKTNKKGKKRRHRTLKIKRKKYIKRNYKRKKKSKKKKQRGGVSFITKNFYETYIGNRSWSFNPNKPFDQNPDKIRGRQKSISIS